MKKLIRLLAVCTGSLLIGLSIAACRSEEPTCTHIWADATCTAPKTCTLCDAVEGDVAEHTWNAGVVTTEPTCTEEGVLTYTCSLCSQSRSERIDVRGHAFDGWTVDVEPTCTVGGRQSHHCLTCGDRLDETELPALEHTWHNGIITTPPTCTEDGEGMYTCSVCSERKSVVVPTPGHDWLTTSEVSATLITEGMEKRRCVACGLSETRTLDMVDPSTLQMPIVYMTDPENASIPLTHLQKADGEITVQYRYVSNDDDVQDFEGYCRIKIQGASSSGYPKKNFTVKLYKDERLESKLKVDLGWGKESKYCLKANYIDASQARNVVAAQMFAQVAASRAHLHTGLKQAPNYGVIDGYPVLVYINGTFYGIYTMNIPKDEWMFGMEGDETTREAVLMAEAWTDSVQLHTKIGHDYTESGWEVEYCSTEDDAWVRESFNRLIGLLNSRNGIRIKTELSEHLDIEAAIDNMIFTYFINAADNTAKNILWATYDGEVWIPSLYDMDGSFGIFWDGSATDAAQPNSALSICPTYKSNGAIKVDNMMYQILLTYFADEVEARYRELRASILTYENTAKCFNVFFDRVPEVAYQTEWQNWPHQPGRDTNRTNMLAATEAQLRRLDKFFYTFNR